MLQSVMTTQRKECKTRAMALLQIREEAAAVPKKVHPNHLFVITASWPRTPSPRPHLGNAVTIISTPAADAHHPCSHAHAMPVPLRSYP